MKLGSSRGNGATRDQDQLVDPGASRKVPLVDCRSLIAATLTIPGDLKVDSTQAAVIDADIRLFVPANGGGPKASARTPSRRCENRLPSTDVSTG